MSRLALILAGLLLAMPAGAAELKVLTAGAFKPVVQDLAPVFAAEGDRLDIQNDTAGALLRRIEAGEAFDVLVLTQAGFARLATAGMVGAGTPLARVAIGVAVRDGAPRPDIGSVDAFRAALLAAPSVAYIDPAAGGSSGIYLAGLFERMGIADAIKAKAVLVPGGLVATRVADGQAALALHQMSELLVVPGVTVVGPLPAAVQNYTTYAGAVATASASAAAANRLLALLAGPEARGVLLRRGMEPPGG
jgi:molybdate transport system substrate-binding protein